LPKRSEIEAKAKRFYDSLTSPMGRIRPKTTAIAGKELSNAILSPVAKKLGQKRLLIVGDGILQYIPFSALPDPVSNSDRRIIGEFASYLQPLLVNHEVINLISPFTMLQSRQRQRTKPTMDLAIVANPVLSRESDLEPIYSPLPQTKREAEQILKYFPSEKRSEFSHFDANHENVVGSNLSRYRLIHFATHSIFNPQSPQKSGVVLSAINQMDEMQVGLVNPDDAFNMNLLGTELVVLSGCRTGLGVQPIREGLTGLTGGFMAAGAKRVLVSLWSVNDDATEKLMTQFYENMMKRSLTPAQALRSAQLAMWQDEQWQTPYNWSAFTLYGDWN
jgi:CHAT domain-containing protein